MRRLCVLVLVAVAAFGCKSEPPKELDLNKDTSDAASKIGSGQKVDYRDVMPKDEK